MLTAFLLNWTPIRKWLQNAFADPSDYDLLIQTVISHHGERSPECFQQSKTRLTFAFDHPDFWDYLNWLAETFDIPFFHPDYFQELESQEQLHATLNDFHCEENKTCRLTELLRINLIAADILSSALGMIPRQGAVSSIEDHIFTRFSEIVTRSIPDPASLQVLAGQRQAATGEPRNVPAHGMDEILHCDGRVILVETGGTWDKTQTICLRAAEHLRWKNKRLLIAHPGDLASFGEKESQAICFKTT